MEMRPDYKGKIITQADIDEVLTEVSILSSELIIDFDKNKLSPIQITERIKQIEDIKKEFPELFDDED